MVYNKMDTKILRYGAENVTIYSSKGRAGRAPRAEERVMLSLNIACIVIGVLGVLAIVACAAIETVGARRRAREAKRRYIHD